MGSKYTGMNDAERAAEQRRSRNERREAAGKEPIYEEHKADDKALSEDHRAQL